MDRKKVKTLIELSTSFEEADEVLNRYTDLGLMKKKSHI